MILKLTVLYPIIGSEPVLHHCVSASVVEGCTIRAEKS